MSYSPSALAQTIAAQLATNLATAPTPGPWPALQSGAVSRLPTEALIDAILLGLASNTYIEVGAGGAPAFQNGWANYGGGFSTAAYFKDACGIVHVKGVVASGTWADTIFTLPVGYRPTLRSIFAACSGDGTVPARVDVDASGNVIAAAGNTGFLSFEFSFCATA